MALSFKITALSGAYALLCAPAILLAEAYHFPQWPFHTSQLAAVVICLVAAAAHLRSSRATPGQNPASQRLALVAVILSALWLSFIVYVMTTFLD